MLNTKEESQMNKKLLVKLTYHILIMVFFLLIFSTVSFAAYLKDVPISVTQPNGDVFNCFASGDEFFNYIHDANGSIIIQDPETGYYTYAQLDGAGKIISSNEIVAEDGYFYDPDSATYSQIIAKSNGFELENIDLDIPVSVEQPNGDVFSCFASDDEVSDYLHDANGFIIIQDPQTGYYTYAQLDDAGDLIASEEIVARAGYYYDPNSIVYSQRIAKSIGLELEEIDFSINSGLVHELLEPIDAQLPPQMASGVGITGKTKSGTMTNTIVMICFAGENQTISSDIKNRMESVFNGSTQSLNHYMKAVSEGKLTLNSTLVGLNGSTILMYRDSNPRSYYQPYSATNPNGYTGGDNGNQRTVREHTLLRNVVNTINGSSILSGKNLDIDNDGMVDSIAFFISGNVEGWNSLLWPHKWSLYSYTANLNGKRVYEYSFQLVDYTFPSYGGADLSVICHETLHTFGLPDLYRYPNNGIPVGAWDIMAYNTANPQFPNSHMRLRYAGWGKPMTEITVNGRYTLSPIGSTTGTTAYAIATSNPNQFILLEYRSDSNPSGYDKYFDTNSSYHKGFTITRINTSYQGNANPDGTTNDEVYIYRPGETSRNKGGGSIELASLSSDTGRTSFGNATSATGHSGTIYLYDNTNTKYVISNVSEAGNTISFNVIIAPIATPKPTAASITQTSAKISWTTVSGATGYKVDTIIVDSNGKEAQRITHYNGTSTSCTVSGLQPSTQYTVCVYAYIGDIWRWWLLHCKNRRSTSIR